LARERQVWRVPYGRHTAVSLEKTYEFFTKQAGFNKDLTFSDRGFEQILKFLGGTVLPAAKDAPVNQFYDTRIIDKLKK
jgi:hypothetical protein